MSFETFSALYFVSQRTLHLLTFELTKEMVVKIILTFFFYQEFVVRSLVIPFYIEENKSMLCKVS